MHEQVDPRVRSMYKDVGKILSRYRSGKLPKAFKVVPILKNWEQVSTLCIIRFMVLEYPSPYWTSLIEDKTPHK